MSIYTELSNAIDAYTGLSPAAFFTILALMIGVYFLVSSCFVHPDSSEASASGSKSVSVPPPTDAEKTPSPPPPPAEEEKTPSPPPALFAEPVQMGEMTLEGLSEYNGSDRNKPLLISIRGDVFNVSRGWLFYGPGGQYSFFAGREISRALALMSFDPIDFNDKLDDLGEDELEVLSDWEEKFKERYVKVGKIVTGTKDTETKNESEQIKTRSHDDDVANNDT